MGEFSPDSVGSEADREAFSRFQRRERCDLAVPARGSLGAVQVVKELVAAEIEALGRLPETRYRGALSLDRLQAEIASLRRDIVGWTMYGLGPYFRWALAETAWIIEHRRSSIPSLENLLHAKFDPEARALYDRILVHFRMAEPEELEADLRVYVKDRPQDFLAQQTLGNILFFRKGLVQEALRHYEGAAFAAVSRSRYHASYAHLHAAYMHYLYGECQEAARDARSALDLSPNLFEAAFHYAHYCALIGRGTEAIQNLTKAVSADRYYCVRIALEPDFESVRGEIGSLFEALRDRARRNARESLNKAERALQMADIAGCRQRDAHNYQILSKEYATADALFKNDTFFDSADAEEIAERLCEQTFKVTRGVLEAHLKELKSEAAARKTDLQNTLAAQNSEAAELLHALETEGKRIRQENHIFRTVFIIAFWVGLLNVGVCFYLNSYLKVSLTVYAVTIAELGILWGLRWLTLRGRLARLQSRRQSSHSHQDRTIEALRKRIDQSEKKQGELGKILKDIEERHAA
ncbi:MAG: hypothetical protein IT210_05865 [Armatimonadetes bacterium]|nr:hypothetical protein [Armatimonadota bacterium]